MPATLLDDVILNLGLPPVTMIDPTQAPEYEKTAWAHWIFDKGDASNLVNRMPNERVLSPIGSGGHTHNSNSITVTGASGSGLQTSLPDQLGFAWCAVVKMPASAATIMSTYDASKGYKTQLALSSTNDIRNSFRGTSPVLLAYDPIITPPTDAWIFIAVSCSLTGTGNFVRTIIYNYGAPQDDSTLTGTRTVATNNFALGTPYEGVAGGAYEMAELILWNSAKTVAFFDAIYLRSKARMAKTGRNISLT